MDERRVWEKLVEIEKRVTVLEGEDYDPFALPSEDARRRAVSRIEVEAFGKIHPIND